MGPLKFGRMIDEKISGLAERIAALGEKILLANGARREGDMLLVPRQQVRTQPMEYFDINDYGPLWNPDWKLIGAGRGLSGATYLLGDILVTYPRKGVFLRLYQWVPASQIPGPAYWRKAAIE